MSMTFDRAGNIGDDIVACHIHIKALMKLLIANFCSEGSCQLAVIKQQASSGSQQLKGWMNTCHREGGERVKTICLYIFMLMWVHMWVCVGCCCSHVSLHIGNCQLVVTAAVTRTGCHDIAAAAAAVVAQLFQHIEPDLWATERLPRPHPSEWEWTYWWQY